MAYRWYQWFITLMLLIFVNQTLAFKVYLATGHPYYPPFSKRVNNEIQGAAVDIAKIVMNRLDKDVSFSYLGDWATVKKHLQNGNIDLLIIAKDPSIYQNATHSEPYLTEPIVVFVKKQHRFYFRSLENLKGKRGVMVENVFYDQKLQNYMNSNLSIQYVKTARDGFLALNNNQADYFIYELYLGNIILKKEQFAGQIEHLHHPVMVEKYFMVVPNNSLLANDMNEINNILTELKEDGTISQIVKKHELDALLFQHTP